MFPFGTTQNSGRFIATTLALSAMAKNNNENTTRTNNIAVGKIKR
jgi:hypothetical protein